MSSGIEEEFMTRTHRLQWYAIRTRSRFEKVVRDQLIGRGIEPLLPLHTRISQWKDRRKIIEWPLFPGYCFGRFTLDEQINVLQVPGVVQIIGSGTYAEPIPDEEIAAIQRIMQRCQQYEPYPYPPAKGTVVQVIRGPLKGIHGTFLRTANVCKLVIAVNLIQQATAVEIDASDVASADDLAPLIQQHSYR
jgi:transcriptional antiterminator NusG